MKLIIAEKPSVAIAIAKALGISGKKDENYLKKENDFYSKIVRYVTSNHDIRLTMKNLSREFNCSVSMLSHL